MADKDDKPQVQVREDDAGGAVVHIPEGFDEHDDADVQLPAGEASASQVSAHDDDAPDAATPPEDLDAADDSEAVREAKRNRRRAKKNLVRETNRQRDLELEQLRRQNAEFAREMQAIKGRQFQQDLNTLDQRITDAQTRVEYARMMLTQATQAQDADAIVRAQEELADAKGAHQQLSNYKTQVTQQAAQPRQPPQPDLTIQRHATQWAKDNPWFDPDKNTRDLDSRIARQVDEVLTQEGYDPRSKEYWDEMNERLRARLPHRYTDEASGRTTPPRNTVAGTGREASGGNGNGAGRGTFVLSPERVKAMKEAGAWDNPERRNRMIRQYREYDRAHRS